jgi:HlyD family secretion protein
MPLVVLLAGCGDADGDVRFVGTLERDRLELTAQSSDPLLELVVREGDAVQAGQVLARQDTTALAASRAAAVARAAEARARLAEAERGPRSETIAQARARVASARAALTAEEHEYARVEKMARDALIAASAVERQREARDRARAAVAEADAALLELKRGTRPERLDQARAAAAAADAEVEKLATDLGRLTLVAPRSATVEALPYRVGERPPAGAPVVVLLADDAPFARVYVPEPQRAALGPGALADVRVDGVDRAFRARLRYVAAQAAFTPYYALNERDRSRLAFLAEFTLDEPEARQLPSGIPVQVAPRASASR